MSAEKKYTERDLVLAKRDAAARARCAALCNAAGWRAHTGVAWSESPCMDCRAAVNTLFPLPKVERLRKEQFLSFGTSYRFAVIDGVLSTMRMFSAAKWEPCTGRWPEMHSAEDVRRLGDLFAHPTELVDDDGAEDGV